eukprot:Skav200955  [mRNA]  locus=scaffold448:215684:219542:+ [translate_table: standard]
MHAIVASVRLSSQSQLGPLAVDLLTQGSLGGAGRVGGAQQLSTEVGPRHLLCRPFDLVVVDAGPWRGEFGSHVHVEAVDDIDVIHLPTVEATAELDDSLALLQGIVLLPKLVRSDAQLLGSVHSVVDQAILHDLAPLHTELLLKFFLSLVLHNELLRLHLHCLRSNCTIVGVDQLLLIDHCRFDLAFGLDGQSLSSELLLHQCLNFLINCMRLDEHKRCVRLATSLHRLSAQAFASGFHDDVGDSVWVAVGSRAAILHVSTAALLGITRDADGCTTVGHTVLESVDVARLVLASETLVIALTVLCNVLLRNLAEGLANLDDGVIATSNTHRSHGEVGVASSAVPVTLRRLGVERANAVVLLCHSQHDVASHCEMVSHLNSTAWADLELPLSRHHLCIDT